MLLTAFLMRINRPYRPNPIHQSGRETKLKYFPFTKVIERPKIAYYHNKLVDV